MRASFMGVAQRVDVRVKVPFAARVRTRVALVQRRFVICHLGNHSIACYVGNIDDKGSCDVVNFDPLENQDFVVFDVSAVDVPVEVVESGIKSAMNVVHVGIVRVIG